MVCIRAPSVPRPLLLLLASLLLTCGGVASASDGSLPASLTTSRQPSRKRRPSCAESVFNENHEGGLTRLAGISLFLRVRLTGARAAPDCTDKCATVVGDFIRLATPAQVQGAVRPTRWLRTALAFCKVRRRSKRPRSATARASRRQNSVREDGTS
jgi:hypothetical protein